MSAGHIRVGVGTRFVYDGEILTVAEMTPTSFGVQITTTGGGHVHRMLIKEMLDHTRSRIIPDDDLARVTDEEETAALILAQLSEVQLSALRLRVEDIREVLTGYRSGSDD
jgi:hypothetical protein